MQHILPQANVFKQMPERAARPRPVLNGDRTVMRDCTSRLFGPAYCISLASRPERRHFCEQQFHDERVPVTFFDAIVPTQQSRFPTLGAYGCYQSHLAVLEAGHSRCQKTGAEYVTVFEDDVLLPRGFASIAEQVVPRLSQTKWHLFYWGTLNEPPAVPVSGTAPLSEIAPQHTIIGKQAYSVHVQTIPPLLRFLRDAAERPEPGYSDGMFHEFRIAHNLLAHTHDLAPARQASFASNITPRVGDWARRPVHTIMRRIQLLTR